MKRLTLRSQEKPDTPASQWSRGSSLLALATLLLSLDLAARDTERAGPALPQSSPWITPIGGPLLLGNVPDVPECRGILRQEILNEADAAKEDPVELFERLRAERRTMEEASPVLECQSKLWRVLRRRSGLGNASHLPPGTERFSLRAEPSDAESLLRSESPDSLGASVGGNVDPAGGVEAYQGEVQVAANPRDPMQLVAGANSFFHDPSAECLAPGAGASRTFGTQALYGSSDGGASWVYHCAPWPASVSASIPTATIWFGTDPAVAWDSQGRSYAAYMLLNCDNLQTLCGRAIAIARSSDHGNSWQSLGTVVDHSGSTDHVDDKEMIAIDNSPGPASARSHPGRIYVIWDDANVERVAYSDDGAHWTTVLLPSATSAIGGNIVVGSDGTVYAIWSQVLSNPQTSEHIWFSRSDDGGNTWSLPVLVVSPALLSFGNNHKPPAQEIRGVNAFGSLALNSTPFSSTFGYLYVVHADFPSGTTQGPNLDIKLAFSRDRGATWEFTSKVNDDTSDATQFAPWVAVDQSDGSVNVSWYDTRRDPNHKKTQFFYARSVTNGYTFEPNLTITDGGTSWRNAADYSDLNVTDNIAANSNQYGDYSGIVAANRSVHPFWTDARNFYPSYDSNSPARQEDAATATLVNCSAPSPFRVTARPTCSPYPQTTVSWEAPASWGTNATGGTYTVYQSATPSFSDAVQLEKTSGTSVNMSYRDGFFYYFVQATNNCPGTPLTPMTTTVGIDQPVAMPYPYIGIYAGTELAFCPGGTATLVSFNATGNQWFRDGSPIAGATGKTYDATLGGEYTAQVLPGTMSCPITVTVFPVPSTPQIRAGGPTTFPPGGSVTLTSSYTGTNRWYRNGIQVATTSSSYVATLSGSYTAAALASCLSSPSAPVVVTAANVLLVTKLGGAGLVTGTGIGCGTDCTEAFETPDSVTLTASALNGSTFAGWAGDCTGTGNCTVSMSAPHTVTAQFNAAGVSYYTLSPCRVYDSRISAAPLVSGQPRVLNTTGVCGIPATAKALILNVTAVAPPATGFLSLWAADEALPATSILNLRSGVTIANNTLASLPADASGRLSIRAILGGGGQVHFIVDVFGYLQ